MISSPKVAVLLAAGRGRRLRPHTDHVPKPLLPIDGRPTLDYVLEAVANSGIERVCLVTNYLETQIHDYVGDGRRWGLTARYAHQPQLDGTGKSLWAAVTSVPAWFDEPFLLSATDYLFSADFLSALVAEQQRTRADIMVSLKRLTSAEMQSRSSIRFRHGADVRFDENTGDDVPNRLAIDEIVEKPAVGYAPSPFGASLIYILPPMIKAELQRLPKSPRGEYEVQGAINALIATGYAARGLLQGAPPEWQPPSGG